MGRDLGGYGGRLGRRDTSGHGKLRGFSSSGKVEGQYSRRVE